MRKIAYILLTLGLVKSSLGQNLVPNPSFEDTVSCPQGPDEINKALYWSSYANSPDFFYGSCPMSVPNNWGGYQQAASGIGYAAISTFSSNAPNLREYIGVQLTTSLNSGVKYFVSFKSSLSLGSIADANCASNNLGVMFSTIPYDIFHPATITNNPQINSNIINSDSIGWHLTFSSFIADSAYSFIIVGNFFDDSNTDTTKFYNTFSDASYYYIDDVCISTDSLFALNYSYTGIEKIDIASDLIFFPNPANEKLYIKNNPQNIEYEIVSIIGESMLKGVIKNNELGIIETINLSEGVYILHVNKRSNYKILIDH